MNLVYVVMKMSIDGFIHFLIISLYILNNY